MDIYQFVTGFKKLKSACKPGSVQQVGAIIHLGHKSPCISSNLPRNSSGQAIVPLFGLAPSGVYPATTVTCCAVRSYRTISPLPAKAGGIFSVALAVDSRLPGVTWHSALWSPDFPPSTLCLTTQRKVFKHKIPGDCPADFADNYSTEILLVKAIHIRVLNTIKVTCTIKQTRRSLIIFKL